MRTADTFEASLERLTVEAMVGRLGLPDFGARLRGEIKRGVVGDG